MQIVHTADKGIDFLMSHTALMEAWTSCGSRRPSGLRLLRFKSLTEDDGTSIQALDDVVSGLPLVLTVMHKYIVLPAAARTALPGEAASKVRFSPAFQHMQSLMRSLHLNPKSEFDADEHQDEETSRKMETSFARAAALNKTIRVQKLKRSIRIQLAKKRSKRRRVSAAEGPVVPQDQIAEGQVVPQDQQARARRPANDNVLFKFGPFFIKKLYPRGVFTAVSAECRKHRTCADPNECARSITMSATMPLEAAVLRLKKWLMLGASVDEDSLYKNIHTYIA